MANNGIVQYYDLLRVESKNDAFISTYSSMYLKGNPCLVPHVQQTDEKVENWILSIASKDKWNLRDVFNIIAWKTGKIKLENKGNPYSKVEDLEYASGCDPDGMTITAYSCFPIRCLAEYIVENLPDLREKAKKGCGIEAFKMIADKADSCKLDKFGTVYILTLLFFLSEREQPIYDTFVMRSLFAFDNDVKPGSRIKGMEAVPGREETEKVKNFYLKFKEKLYNRFGDGYKTDRKIDRALWVYGHYFKA